MKKVLLLVGFIFIGSIFSQEKETLKDLKAIESKNTIHLNFIPVQMPTDFDPSLKTTMGMMGLHYKLPINNWLYGSVGMYAAITGDQGGLFTLGAALGIQKKIHNNFYLDANFHFGGGGGYRYLINDGAYVNPNIGINYKQKNYNFGLQFSHVNFYTGKVKSNSVSFFIEIPVAK